MKVPYLDGILKNNISPYANKSKYDWVEVPDWEETMIIFGTTGSNHMTHLWLLGETTGQKYQMKVSDFVIATEHIVVKDSKFTGKFTFVRNNHSFFIKLIP